MYKRWKFTLNLLLLPIGMLILFFLLSITNRTVAAENNIQKDLQKLSVASGVLVDGLQKDWLVCRPAEKAGVFKNEKGNELVLSNGIISRLWGVGTLCRQFRIWARLSTRRHKYDDVLNPSPDLPLRKGGVWFPLLERGSGGFFLWCW